MEKKIKFHFIDISIHVYLFHSCCKDFCKGQDGKVIIGTTSQKLQFFLQNSEWIKKKNYVRLLYFLCFFLDGIMNVQSRGILFQTSSITKFWCTNKLF